MRYVKWVGYYNKADVTMECHAKHGGNLPDDAWTANEREFDGR